MRHPLRRLRAHLQLRRAIRAERRETVRIMSRAAAGLDQHDV